MVAGLNLRVGDNLKLKRDICYREDLQQRAPFHVHRVKKRRKPKFAPSCGILNSLSIG